MRIIEEYNEIQGDILEIKSAKYISDFAIQISFNNGVNRLVDFKPFLNSSLHPSIRKYLNENLFEKFDLIDGNLNWNDYDLIFPIENLYEGRL
jgi:hypothetical protein